MNDTKQSSSSTIAASNNKDEHQSPKSSVEQLKDKHEGREQPAAQQQPVNFGTDSSGADPTSENNHPNSRRVTIGGNNTPSNRALTSNNVNVGNSNTAANVNSNIPANSLPGLGMGGMMDRRGSMNSLGMDDFFSGIGGGFESRRASMAGFDAVDSLFGPYRRDSMDSAMLDSAAFMDLQARRFSLGLPPFPQDSVGLPSLGNGPGSYGNIQNSNPGPAGSTGGGTSQDSINPVSRGAVSAPHESLAARQAQLQAQQRELELKQKQLEIERRRLLENIRQRSYETMPNDRRYLEMENMSMGRRPSFPYTSGDGLIRGPGGPAPGMETSSHSHLTSVSLDQSGRSHNTQHSYYHRQGMDGSMGSQGARSSRNWHICQFCTSKAFASLDEAIAHESVCMENPSRNGYMGPVGPLSNQSVHGGVIGPSYFGGHSGGMFDRRSHGDNMMHPPSFYPSDGIGRNFSIGMDTSQRSAMSLGMGGMDGPLGRGSSIGMGSIGGGMDASQRSTLSLSTGMDVSQRSNLSVDGSSHSYRELSNGPWAPLQHPMPLAMDCDKDWLTPLHCFVRRHCVEVFTATDDDVATPSKGKRKPIHVGQIGIRCPHCHRYGVNSSSSKSRERGSVYYPTTIKSIYNATMNLLQRHLHSCPAVPEDIMRRYETLKADDARSGTSKRYWEESALSLGLVDTHNGIRFSALRPPPLPTLTLQQESTGQSPARRNSNEFFSTKSNAMSDMRSEGADVGDSNAAKHRHGDEDFENNEELSMSKAERAMADSAPLVTPEDKPYSTLFSYHLLGQMQPCVFTEADRLGKRKGLPPGFPGLACRHCFGGYGSGRFFPSSIKTLSDTSKTLNVLHNHMMRCRKCPAEVRETLDKLRGSHDEERAKMKFGSQKAFFARIWERLHGKGYPGALKRSHTQQSGRSASRREQQQQNQHHASHSGQPLSKSQGFVSPALEAHENSPKPDHTRSPLRQQQREQLPIPQSRNDQRSPRLGPEQVAEGIGGLETLAAASSPSKRQKVE